MNKRQHKQSGFTLIELVIVIVIIGILAAVAIPNFSSMTDDARSGVADGVAGAFASSAATNFAACQGNLGSCITDLACSTSCVVAMVPDQPNATATLANGVCTITLDGATSRAVTIRAAPAAPTAGYTSNRTCANPTGAATSS